MKTVKSIVLCFLFVFGLNVFAGLHEEAAGEYEEQIFDPVLLEDLEITDIKPNVIEDKRHRIKPNVIRPIVLRPIVAPVSTSDEESLKIFKEQLEENHRFSNEEYALKPQVITGDDEENCLKPQVITGDDEGVTRDEGTCLKPQVIVPN